MTPERNDRCPSDRDASVDEQGFCSQHGWDCGDYAASRRILTPYDTGERLEPVVWPLHWTRPRPTQEDLDCYGRVDFDDDSGQTLVTVHARRAEDGTYELVVDNFDPERVRIVREEA